MRARRPRPTRHVNWSPPDAAERSTPIAVGLRRGRNDYLVAGTAAIVVDVIAYLVRHGLEQDFFASALLVLSGLTVLTAAAVKARRRRAA